MNLFVSAGEVSGDRILAAVLAALRERVPALKVRGLGGEASAQEAPAAPAELGPPAAAAEPAAKPAAPAAEAAVETTPSADTEIEAAAVPPAKIAPIFPPPVDRPPAPKREKLQATSVGMRLGGVDFGAEADIVSSVGRLKPAPDNRRWTYALRGFFRAPMRVGIGPETGRTEGSQLHSPPRVVGFGSDEWSYINVAPGATGQLEVAVTNQRV